MNVNLESNAKAKSPFCGNIPLASTTTPLAGNATVNSGWMTCKFFARLVGTCFADQAGTLYIDFSGDGVNVDYTRTIAIAANDTANSAFDQLIPAPFVRFRYVNGATPSTVFRFYAYGKAVS